MEPSESFVSPRVEASLQCVLKYLYNAENRRSFQLTLSVEEKQECVVLADLLKNGSLKCIKSVGTVLDSVQDTCNRCSHPAMGRRGEIHLSFSLEDIACDTCDNLDKKSEGAVLSDSSDSGTHHTRRRQSGVHYCCTVCKELFITPAYLRKHILEDTCCSTKEEVRTSDTSKSIVTTNPLSSARADLKMVVEESTDTMNKNTDKTYKCDVCTKTFSRQNRLKEHKRTHLQHSSCCDTTEEVRNSDTSKSIVSTNPLSSVRADLEVEESTDTMKPSNKRTMEDRKNADKTYTCDVCTKTFSGQSRLGEHKLSHLPRSQFAHKCNLCRKSFKSSGHLHEHKGYCKGNKISTHGKDISMTNPKDDCVLEQDSDVVLHESYSASHDQAMTRKIDRCKVCGQIFKTASHLKEHMLIHLKDSVGRDQKSEKDDHVLEQESDVLHEASSASHDHAMTRKIDRCKVCGQIFKTASHLKEHMLIHLNDSKNADKPYKCDVCGKTFSLPFRLKEHKLNHLPRNQFAHKCNLCGNSFKRTAHLNKHKRYNCHGNTKLQEADQCRGERTAVQHEIDVKNDNVKGDATMPVFDQKSEKNCNPSTHGKDISVTNPKDDHVLEQDSDVVLHEASSASHDQAMTQKTDLEYRCALCDKMFTRSASLRRHQKTHNPGKRAKVITKSLDSETEKFIMDTRKFQIFSCSVCNMGFRTKLKLKFHVMTHLSLKRYSCDECEKSFITVKRLEEHCLSHMSSRGLTCSLCTEEESFSSSWNLYKHMKTHWGENRLLCRSCNTEFESPEFLAEHHCEVEFFCNMCGEDFPNQTVGVEHAGYHDQFECKVCKKVLSSDWKLDRHMMMHADGKITDKQSTCNDCGKTFKRDYIRQHKLTHAKTNAFKCNICSSSFKTQHSLGYHRRIMHKIKGSPTLFQCHLCGKKMSTQESFDKHLESKCMFNEDEKQKCKICGLVAFNSVRLEQHMRIHSGGEQPFICELCGKGFYSRSSLGSHLATHENYRPHSCDICGRKFRNRPHMKNHRKMHTGEGLLQCKECKDWFIDASYLKNQHFKHCRGGKVYQCQDCPRVFNDKKFFENHLEFHTGARPFECNECGRAFLNEASCNDHYKRHIEDFKIRCPLCHQGFWRMNQLEKHKKLHDKNHNYKRRYTLSEDVKPKQVVQDKIITEEELGQATLLLTDEMTTSQPVVKEEVQTQFDHQQIAKGQVTVDKVRQVYVEDLKSGVPSTTIENANGEQVVTITTLPSGEMTFSHGGLSNESMIVVTIDPSYSLVEDVEKL